MTEFVVELSGELDPDQLRMALKRGGIRANAIQAVKER